MTDDKCFSDDHSIILNSCASLSAAESFHQFISTSQRYDASVKVIITKRFVVIFYSLFCFGHPYKNKDCENKN